MTPCTLAQPFLGLCQEGQRIAQLFGILLQLFLLPTQGQGKGG